MPKSTQRLVDVGHPVDDLGLLGEEVVEAHEVAVRRGLAGEGGVAPVVVVRRVVEPGRLLHRAVGVGAEDRRVGEGGLGVELGEGVPARVVGVVELRSRGVPVGRGLLADVGVALLLVVDDVRGVVGDDVEEDLDPAGVRLVDERLELGVGAEVRVDPGEVGDPVAVVPGRGVLARALDRAVPEGRGQPDRAGAEALDVVELLGQAGDVAAVVEALVLGVEAGREPVALEAAGVVAGVAVGEPVGHHEVEVLARRGLAQRGSGQALVGRGDLAGRLLRRGERHRVRDVVVAEPERRGVLEVQRQVGAAVSPAAVALLPRTVEGHLELVAARRDGEDRVVRRGARPVHGAQPGRLAGRPPVALAAELVLERPDQGHALRQVGVVRRGRAGGGDRGDQRGGGHQRRERRGGGPGGAGGGTGRARGATQHEGSRHPRGGT